MAGYYFGKKRAHETLTCALFALFQEAHLTTDYF